MEAIVAKTTGQNTIESYRNAIADINTWFDNVIKKIDTIDVGSGLNCAQKLDAIAKLQNDAEVQGQQKLADLKQKAQQAVEIISNLDAQQIEEQLKSSERRYNDIVKRVARKAQMVAATSKGVEAIRNEIQQLDDWLQQQLSNLQLPQTAGFDSNLLNVRLQKLKTLTKDAEVKQTLADTLERRVFNMQNDLEPLEKTQLESDLHNAAAKQKELMDLLKSEITSVTDAVQGLKSFESDLDKVKAWIKSKLIDVRKQSATVPLQSKAVENEIQMAKNNEAEIKKFGEQSLNEVQKQAQNILKNCSDNDKQSLEKILGEISGEFNELKNEATDKVKNLNEVFEGRKAFEVEVSKLDDWLNKVEISTMADIQIKSLPILEEQLIKFNGLSADKEAMKPLLTSLTDRSKAMLPTLNNADRLKLNEQMKTLKDKYSKPTINDRIRTIEEHIKRYKESKAKLAECVDTLNRIKQEIRDLSKPIGNQPEDVKSLINTYEQIVRSIGNNKNKVNEIQIDDSPELQSILAQHDEISNSVEKQISNLRQSLSLREQYYTLIDQIETLISKYTVTVSEIDKSTDSIDQKINQYDDMITKIQECEGLLASAHDKGQKIASEGTVADGNAITEHIQSLKQKLQNLRKRVESQRQKHENTLAEHNKVANELSGLLLWLHNNEALCKSRPLLERDPDSVDREITKHNLFATDVQKNLDEFQKIDEQLESETGIPVSVVNMLSEGRSLLTNLPNELDERNKYLTNSKQHRIDYITKAGQFKSWINDAEGYLDDCKHGIDYKNLSSNIDKCNVFFENERPIRELVTTGLQQTVDYIWPTLQSNEQDELSGEVRQQRHSLESTLDAAKKHRSQLEQNIADWNAYRDLLNAVQTIIDQAKIDDEPGTSLAILRSNLEKVTRVLNDLKVSSIHSN